MATRSNPLDRYKESQVKTANQGKLIVMLYDAAIKNVRDATEAISDFRKYDVVNSKLSKAEDIITELLLGLNMGAGEVAERLHGLYNYIYRLLIDANIRKDAKPLEEAAKILSGLRDAWARVAAGEPANRQPGKGVDIEG